MSHSPTYVIQGRASEAVDTLIQRMKSLEMTASGAHWMTSQKLELVPPAEPSMGGRLEYQVAQREQKLDSSIKGTPSTEKGKGKSSSKGKEKGSTKGKNKNKEADAKKGSAPAS